MILIVDDHLDTGVLLARLLRKCGHDAVAVGSGPAALELLRESKPDLIVLDREMPDMDGLAVLRAVRADADAAGVPVIFYSAYGDAGTIGEALQLGAQDYLVKGVTPLKEVCETVQRYVAAPVVADG